MQVSNSLIALTAGSIAIPTFYFGRKYFAGPKCNLTRDLSGQVIIITGSSAGVGLETARALAQSNPKIIFACRNQEKTQDVINNIQQETGNKNLEFMHLDFDDLKSVKSFAEKFKAKHSKLDILINNAGILGSPERKVTKDEIEAHFAVNCLGPFYLSNLLLDILQKSKEARIINVSSFGHKGGKFFWDDLMLEKNYSIPNAYGQSKLGNVTLVKALQKKLDDSKIKVVNVNPGIVMSEGFRNIKENKLVDLSFKVFKPFMLYFLKSSKEGAQTTIYCAMEKFERLEGGAYYSDCKKKDVDKKALEVENQEKLWKICEDLIKKKVAE